MIPSDSGDHPSSSIFLSNSASETRYAVSGFLTIASYSSFSRCWLYFSILSVCPCRILLQPLTTGLSTVLIVPNTKVGKNMMHSPTANGRNSGYTSTGSALARACHTLAAIKNKAPSPATPFATPIISPQSGNISAYRFRRIWCKFSNSASMTVYQYLSLALPYKDKILLVSFFSFARR